MPNRDPQRVNELRILIADFLKTRRDDKLDKVKDDDDAPAKREELHQQFVASAWLDDAARRVGQIQAVTHSLKPIHSDAKGTTINSKPQHMAALSVVGSHCLGNLFAIDFVCNAPLLPIVAFLKLEHQGNTLLALALRRDVNLAAALSDDPEQAQVWMSAFAGIVESRGRVASHALAKQCYWLIDNELDPHDDASFHLLAPLYASSLAHRVYLNIQDDRFSAAAKDAREARKDGTFSERPVREYPQMAVQKLGGTKPQNISQLNSERRGDNFLLASLPPLWRSVDIKPLLGTDSMFDRYGWRTEVKKLVRTLLAFFKSDPASNLATRERRDELVNNLIDEFLQFSGEIQSLEPGWSQVPVCQLGGAEKHWLDPDSVAQACAESGLPLPTETLENVSRNFANWLNALLRDPLPMGDPEFMHWRELMLEQLKEEEREGRHDN
jgi:CRISPR-associated protein Csy1